MSFRKLMFEKEDVRKSQNELLRLIRIIFYRKHVTHDDFVAKHTDYFSRNNIPAVRQNHDKNNLRRNLEDNKKFTFRTFRHVLMNIMYFDIRRISITIIDRQSGEEVTYHSDDPLRDDEE